MNMLNRNQALCIVIAVLAVLMASTAQLNDLFGAQAAKIIISAAGLLNGVLSAVLAVLVGPASMIKAVAATPGIETIKVNAQASPAIAKLAVDPAVNNVAPTDKDFGAVTANAQK